MGVTRGSRATIIHLTCIMSLGSWFVFGYEGFPLEDRRRFYSQRDDPCDSDEERRGRPEVDDGGMRCFRQKRQRRRVMRRAPPRSTSEVFGDDKDGSVGEDDWVSTDASSHSDSNSDAASSSGRGDRRRRLDYSRGHSVHRDEGYNDDDDDDDEGRGVVGYGSHDDALDTLLHDERDADSEVEVGADGDGSSFPWASWHVRDRCVKIFSPLQHGGLPVQPWEANRTEGAAVSFIAAAAAAVPSVCVSMSSLQVDGVGDVVSVMRGTLSMLYGGLTIPNCDGPTRLRGGGKLPHPCGDVSLVEWTVPCEGAAQIPRSTTVLRSTLPGSLNADTSPPVRSLKRWFPSSRPTERFGHAMCGLPTGVVDRVFAAAALNREWAASATEQHSDPDDIRGYDTSLEIGVALTIGGSLQSDPRADLHMPMQRWNLAGTVLLDPAIILCIKAVSKDGDAVTTHCSCSYRSVTLNPCASANGEHPPPRAFFGMCLMPDPIAVQEQSRVSEVVRLLLFGGTEVGVEPSAACGVLDLLQLDLRERTCELSSEPVRCIGLPPAPRFGHSMTSVGSWVVICGGHGGSSRGYLEDLYRLDVNTMVWSEVMLPMPPIRSLDHRSNNNSGRGGKRSHRSFVELTLSARAFHTCTVLRPSTNLTETSPADVSLLFTGGETTHGRPALGTCVYHVTRNVWEMTRFPLLCPIRSPSVAYPPMSATDGAVCDALERLRCDRACHAPLEDAFGGVLHGAGAAALPVTTTGASGVSGILVVGGRSGGADLTRFTSGSAHSCHTTLQASVSSFIALQSSTLKTLAGMWLLRSERRETSSTNPPLLSLTSHEATSRRRTLSEGVLQSWSSTA